MSIFYSEVSIYTLADPRDGRTRYVGKTTNPKRRMENHTVPSRLQGICHRQNWIRQLRSAGLKPIFQIVEVVAVGGDWEEAERRWICLLREQGCDLVNTTPGGEGGATMTGRTRKHSAETRAKISASRRGISPVWSDETKRNRAVGIRAAWQRRKAEGRTSWGRHAEETRMRMSELRSAMATQIGEKSRAAAEWRRKQGQKPNVSAEERARRADRMRSIVHPLNRAMSAEERRAVARAALEARWRKKRMPEQENV
jgi:hypothetical protein